MAGDPRLEAAIATATESAEWDARQQHLAVSFERILVAGDAAVASFVVGDGRRVVVWLEWTGERWDSLGSAVLGPEAEGLQSFRPSEGRPGHWTVIVAGLAPPGSQHALVTFAGEEHRVPVVDQLYLFAVGVEGEPKLERLAVKLRD